MLGPQAASAEPKLIETTPGHIRPASMVAPRMDVDSESGISSSTMRASGAIAWAHWTSSLLSGAHVALDAGTVAVIVPVVVTDTWENAQLLAGGAANGRMAVVATG